MRADLLHCADLATRIGTRCFRPHAWLLGNTLPREVSNRYFPGLEAINQSIGVEFAVPALWVPVCTTCRIHHSSNASRPVPCYQPRVAMQSSDSGQEVPCLCQARTTYQQATRCQHGTREARQRDITSRLDQLTTDRGSKQAGQGHGAHRHPDHGTCSVGSP